MKVVDVLCKDLHIQYGSKYKAHDRIQLSLNHPIW